MTRTLLRGDVICLFTCPASCSFVLFLSLVFAPLFPGAAFASPQMSQPTSNESSTVEGDESSIVRECADLVGRSEERAEGRAKEQARLTRRPHPEGSSAESSDPSAAALYREAGEDELKRGAIRSALSAFKEALRLDPKSLRSREVIEMICEIHAAKGDRAKGDELLALEARAERIGVRDPSLEMLVGLHLLDHGDAEGARPRFEFAALDPDLSDDAKLLLLDLALEDERIEDARSLFVETELGSRSLRDLRVKPLDRQAPIDALLLPTSSNDADLLWVGYVETAFDSNLDLASVDGRREGTLAAGAAVYYRAAGAWRPTARAHAIVEKRWLSSDLDVFSPGCALSVSAPLVDDNLRLDLEYIGDLVALEWRLQAVSHGPSAGVSFDAGSYRAGLMYAPSFQHFLGDDSGASAGLSVRHIGQAQFSLEAIERWSVELEYDFVFDSGLSGSDRYREHDARASVSWRPLEELRLRAEIGGYLRGYPAWVDVASDATTDRRDFTLDTLLVGTYQATGWLDLVLHVGARDAFSNLEDWSYAKIFFGLGARFSLRPG